MVLSMSGNRLVHFKNEAVVSLEENDVIQSTECELRLNDLSGVYHTLY